MLTLLRHWRIVVLLGFGLVCGVLGWRLHPNEVTGSSIPPIVQTVEKLVVKTVTVTKRPDGTIIESTEEKEQTSQVSKPVPRSKYSVSAAASILPTYPLKRPEYQFMGWRRVGEWDGWVGAGWDTGRRAVLVGVRWDL